MKQTNRQTDRSRHAFTMIELTLVIVVMALLAAMALPRYERDLRQEAADNILSAIRYTRLMALTDDVTNPSNNSWQRAFWRIGIEKCTDNGIFYYIGSDKDYGGGINTSASNPEYINDPANGLKMMGANNQPCETTTNNGASNNIFLTKNYGIKNGDISIDCGDNDNQYIGFDYLGRPHNGFTGSSSPDYSSLLHTNCKITVNFSESGDDPINIIIEKGTGHAYIEGEPDS